MGREGGSLASVKVPALETEKTEAEVTGSSESSFY